MVEAVAQTSRLSFSWTPQSVVVAVIAIGAILVISLIACRRSQWRSSQVILESIRIAIVVLMAILLGGPQWVEQTSPNRRPRVAVLWDDSDSMKTEDVVRNSSTVNSDSVVSTDTNQFVETEPTTATATPTPRSSTSAISTTAISRQKSIEPLTLAETWQRLAERADVSITPFSAAEAADGVDSDAETGGTNGTDNDGKLDLKVRSVKNGTAAEDASPTSPIGTDLSTPLLSVAAGGDNLLGIVLISDGDWNRGPAPVQAAGRLRALGVPVFAIATGSESRLPDVEVVSFDVPTFAIAGKRVRIPFSIDSSLPRDQSATVTMTTAGGEKLEKQIRVAAMGRTRDAFDWQPTEMGEQTLTVSIPEISGEIRSDNNSMIAPISVREEKLRVLVIESVPRWEYRYLRNALSRDPGVEVSCLLFHPSLDKRGGGNTDYIREFPATKEELAAYDVVFLGDVGLGGGGGNAGGGGQLTVQQCQWLRQLVGSQASGLVFMPGMRGGQFELLDTELGELMPVQLDNAQPGGWGSRTPQHFELTQLGRRSLLTKLADTADENLGVWENLPGFQWYAPVLSAKPGTETLAVHQEASNQYGRLPLLVTRTFGSGKVLFMGTDGAWRWRKGVEDKYHYRFWGQVVRWMAYRRNMAKGETMRLYYWPEQPQVRQTVSFGANVMENSGEPLERGDVRLRVTPPSGRAKTIRFESDGDQWGAFSGSVRFEEPGEHRLTLFCNQTNGQLETTIQVRGGAIEQIGKPARPEVMEEIARVSRGQLLTADRIDDVVGLLAAMPDPPPTIRRTALYSQPWVAAGLILLLGLFWIGRKAAGLI